MKWAIEGGVAKSELELPSLDRLSQVSLHLSPTLVVFGGSLNVESLSSRA